MNILQTEDNKIINACGFVARWCNRILNIILSIIALLILIYCTYAVWDTWSVISGAGVSSSLLNYKPELNLTEEENPTVQELMAIYPDVRAWITIEDTNIDYPVVQAEDNRVYVNYDIDGQFSLSGEIFLDFRNSGDFSDTYSILYGHHMEFNAMFGGLDLYADEEYFESHTVGYLFLPNTTLEMDIFAYVSTSAYDTILFDPIVDTTTEKETLLAEIESQASVYREVEIAEDETIIALTTCSSSGTDARTVVFAVLRTMTFEG